MAGGKGKGRKKVEMVKMHNENNLLVTFSKRRADVFKKASELSTLCGAEVAVVVFSPGEKAFSFGHPSVEAVVDKFLGQDNPPPQVNESGGVALPTEQLIEAHRNARVSELITELSLIEMEMEMEKKRGEEIDGIVKANREAQGWMRSSYDELNLEQLVALNNGMETLMNDVYQKTYNQLIMTQGNGFPPVGSTSTALNGGGDGGGASGGVTASAFPVSAYMPSGINIASTGSGAGALPFNGGNLTASAFPVNAYTPSGINIANSGGPAGALPFSGGDPIASALLVNDYMLSGINIASTGDGAGALPFSSGDPTASAFRVNDYMPSGIDIANTGGGVGALPFSAGNPTASALPINAYMPSGINIATTGGDAGTLSFSGGDPTASAFPVNAYMPSGINIASTSGGAGALPFSGGSTAFPINDYLPSGLNNASTSSASGSGANLGYGGSKFF